MHVNVASAAGAYTVGNASFFRYILRLGELGLAAVDRGSRSGRRARGGSARARCRARRFRCVSGRGWRVVPAQGELDWPVLEATPERLHSALERARSIALDARRALPRQRRRDRGDRRRARRGLRRAHARRSRGRRRQHFLRSLSRPRADRLFEMPLRGAGGEPISFARTIHSHGCARLPPATVVEESPLVYRRRFRARAARRRGRDALAATASSSSRRGDAAAARRRRSRGGDRAHVPVRRRSVAVLRADRRRRMRSHGRPPARDGSLASPSVFEDVVKTICTTNCAWSATIRMTRALVDARRRRVSGSRACSRRRPRLVSRRRANGLSRTVRQDDRARRRGGRAGSRGAAARAHLPTTTVEDSAARAAGHRPVRRGARHAVARAPSAA